MKRTSKISVFTGAITVALMGFSSSGYAWVAGLEDSGVSQVPNTKYYNPETGEIRNTIVLHQRITERELNTARGIVSVPFSAELIDSRPVDQWYEKQDANVTFVFKNDKIIRVEIFK